VLPDDTLWTFDQLAPWLAGPAWNFYALYTLGMTLVFAFLALLADSLRRSQDWFGMYLALLLLSWANGVWVFFRCRALLCRESLIWAGLRPGLFLLLYLFPSGHIVRAGRWLAWAWGLFSLYGFVASIFNTLPEYYLYTPINHCLAGWNLQSRSIVTGMQPDWNASRSRWW
jgi:hypothetical protein